VKLPITETTDQILMHFYMELGSVIRIKWAYLTLTFDLES